MKALEGFSPHEMHFLVHYPFDPECPVRFRTEVDHNTLREGSPLYKLAVAYLTRIETLGGIKLTQAGYIPPKILREFYKAFLKPEDDIYLELRMSSLPEARWYLMTVVRYCCEFARITRKYKGYICLTQKGKDLLDKKGMPLFIEILQTYTTKFNRGYFDGYDEYYGDIAGGIGRIGWLWLLWILKKYGKTFRHVNFYPKKYLNAFPKIFQTIENDEHFPRAFELRFFDWFCDLFGFYKKERNLLSNSVKSSSLLNEILLCDKR